mmetsp:Transcript_28839/g.44834  ORF Transcript_28839/g.44834 Transcript_28839/m.44834 type:complete len:153 (+) Transcript_28839:167-625(+)
MSWSKDIPSLLLVGAVWGCTNPFLRRGMADDDDNTTKATENSSKAHSENKANGSNHVTTEKHPKKHHMLQSLLSFRRISVWLPYALNQSGSLLYYRLLATSDLSLAVPICNALALAFGSITAWFLGESVDSPMRAMCGCALISVGVIICMMS